ncbi:TraK family protein [Pseudomonas alvandae]|uniref:TraK family protein n=1 Tax=Pseudomonas TaxID=286 RepID=UPI0038999CB6
MTNWRTLPRTGKSQFIPLMPEIQQRLNLGQTYKQIHDALVESENITLGYQQFVKYINKLMNISTNAKPATPIIPGVPSRHPSGEHPLAHLAANRENRRNQDADIHNPVPDPKKIYGE